MFYEAVPWVSPLKNRVQGAGYRVQGKAVYSLQLPVDSLQQKKQGSGSGCRVQGEAVYGLQLTVYSKWLAGLTASLLAS